MNNELHTYEINIIIHDTYRVKAANAEQAIKMAKTAAAVDYNCKPSQIEAEGE